MSKTSHGQTSAPNQHAADGGGSFEEGFAQGIERAAQRANEKCCELSTPPVGERIARAIRSLQLDPNWLEQREQAAEQRGRIAQGIAWRTHLEECFAGRVELQNDTMSMIEDDRARVAAKARLDTLKEVEDFYNTDASQGSAKFEMWLEDSITQAEREAKVSGATSAAKDGK
jgi:hypothetical protein